MEGSDPASILIQKVYYTYLSWDTPATEESGRLNIYPLFYNLTKLPYFHKVYSKKEGKEEIPWEVFKIGASLSNLQNVCIQHLFHDVMSQNQPGMLHVPGRQREESSPY